MTLRRASSPLVAVAFGAVGTIGISGCQAEPSFELRWSLDRSQRADFSNEPLLPLVRADQCSRVGLRDLRMLVYEDAGARRLVAVDSIPCFPAAFRDPAETYGGLVLDDGAYVVALQGVQSGPSRAPWLEASLLPPECAGGATTAPDACQPCTAEGNGCLPGFEVCDCHPLSVRASDTPPIADFVLVAPPECNDGIDGDRDGWVDLNDPGCHVPASCEMPGVPCPPQESTPANENTLSVGLRWLGVEDRSAPTGLCSSLGISTISVALTPAEPMAPEVWRQEIPCHSMSARDRSFGLHVPAGDYQLSATALDSDGSPQTHAVVLDLPLHMGPQSVDIDFWGEDFLNPLQGAATVSLCEGTDLAITHARVQVIGPRGVDAVVEDAQGRPLDGTPLPCQSLVTEPLTFGLYAVEVTLMAEDVPCFQTGDAAPPLWPDLVTPVLAPRVLGGEGCPECLYDVHCGDTSVCIGSICQPPA